MDVCEKIVNYGRTQIVGNEEQFLATVLSLVSCYAPDDRQYISTIIVGESAGGKTHVQLTAFSLINDKHVKVIAGGSEKSPIYSEELRRDNNEIKLIRLSELNKLPPAILEYMKGLSGDDGEFIYEYTNSAKGRTEKIKQKKRPYSVTYAQVDIDKELKTRVFIIPVVENVDINRCVAALKFGATEVEYRGRKYGIGTDKGNVLKQELIDTIESLSQYPMDVVIDYPFALIDMVNHSRPESKRHAQLISSLIASSCRLNFNDRIIRDGKLVASAQDVVNIMSMFNLLQTTMMGIDMLDSLMYKFITRNPRCSSSDIIAYLTEWGLGELTRTELTRRLDKLHDENYIEREFTPDGRKYYANKSKQILSIKVDWKQIYNVDPGRVRDPLTSIEYDNILEFGEKISQVHKIVEPDSSIKSVEYSNADIREAIIAVLESEGALGEHELAQKAAAQVENKSWIEATEEIHLMTDENMICKLDHNGKYSIRM